MYNQIRNLKSDDEKRGYCLGVNDMIMFFNENFPEPMFKHCGTILEGFVKTLARELGDPVSVEYLAMKDKVKKENVSANEHFDKKQFGTDDYDTWKSENFYLSSNRYIGIRHPYSSQIFTSEQELIDLYSKR